MAGLRSGRRAVLPSSNIRIARSRISTDAQASFSLELSPDLRDMRDWVHDFAERVIRPAGAEWDEREETP
jgi:hypothetical protein